MSSQLGQRQEAIWFQLSPEENTAGEVKHSEPEVGDDKQRTTKKRIISQHVHHTPDSAIMLIEEGRQFWLCLI